MAQSLGSLAGHNRVQVLEGVTQDEYLDWLDEMREQDQLVADAVAERKNKLASIKAKLGGKDEMQAFLRTRRDSEMSGEARERRDRAYRLMMVWQRKPVPADTIEDDGNLIPLDLDRIQEEGQYAGSNGRRRESNPYSPGTAYADDWDAAWLRGQAEIQDNESVGADGEPRRRGRPPGSRDRAPRSRRSREEMQAGVSNGDDRLQ